MSLVLVKDLREFLAAAVRRAPPDKLGPLLMWMMQDGIVEDRREEQRVLPAPKRVRNRKPKQKRNDGPCHFPGCTNRAIRPLNMFCKELHGKLPKGEKQKLNEKWKKAHS